jgi:hypothetical protein
LPFLYLMLVKQSRNAPSKGQKLMLRIAMASAVVVTFVAFGTFSALAQQSPSATSKSPGEIAAASRRLAEKQENCRLQAKQQKLTFLKRRRFLRECKKKS